MSTSVDNTASTPGNQKASLYHALGKVPAEGPWDAIVIGSGMGGMACAAALAKYGRRCLVLEQHYVPGGFTHTFSRKNYTWDVGVHCVGEMSSRDLPGRILNWLSDGKLEWQKLGDVYEKFFFPDGFEIEFPSTPEGFRGALLEKFPNERDSIERYFKAVKEVTREAKTVFALRTMPEWIGTMGLKMVHRNKSNPWARTTAEVLNELVPNPKLRAVLTAQWGYYGATPSESSFAIHALVTTHFLRGGYYPVGGSQNIAQTLLNTVREAGGETLVRASVDKVIVERGKAVGVRLTNGQEFRAPRVISAAGARLTADQLVPDDVRDSTWGKEIGQLKQSPPHICLYMGIEGDIRAAGGTQANQWFMNTWDMEVRDWDITDPNSVAPVLYMSFPTLKDPHYDPGPTQKHTAEVVTFVPWHAFEQWQSTRRGLRDKQYMEFKKGIEDRLIAQLKQRVPKILEITKYQELSTPLSTVHFTRAPQGAIYGLAPTTERFTTPKLRVRTPVKNLYLAGGDVATLGVTGALMGGVLAAATVEPRVFTKMT